MLFLPSLCCWTAGAGGGGSGAAVNRYHRANAFARGIFTYVYVLQKIAWYGSRKIWMTGFRCFMRRNLRYGLWSDNQ